MNIVGKLTYRYGAKRKDRNAGRYLMQYLVSLTFLDSLEGVELVNKTMSRGKSNGTFVGYQGMLILVSDIFGIAFHYEIHGQEKAEDANAPRAITAVMERIEATEHAQLAAFKNSKQAVEKLGLHELLQEELRGCAAQAE